MSIPKPLETFQINLQVRDYECDIQGIVNNAVYANYFEHARHQYLLSKGLTFTDLHEKGIDLVLSEISIKFKQALKPNHSFTIHVTPQWKSPARLIFKQTIVHQKTIMAQATATVVCMINNKIRRFPDELQNLAT